MDNLNALELINKPMHWWWEEIFFRNSGLKNHVIDDDYIEGGCYKLQTYETNLWNQPFLVSTNTRKFHLYSECFMKKNLKLNLSCQQIN